MLYFTTGSTDASENLAYEQYLFDTLPAGQAAFGLWQNKSAVIVGRHQNTAEEIDADFVRQSGMQVIRRLSGGGAVYHDLGNLNFTFIADQPAGEKLDFAFFTRPVLAALAALGVPAELSGRNDLCIAGRKFSGNAQYIRGGRVLHHGTLLFASDLGAVTGALRPSKEKLAARGVASVASRVTNIAEHLPRPQTLAEFWAHLLACMEKEQPLTPYAPTADDATKIAALRDSRYATWAWNWGASPRYTARRSLRCSGGGVTAYVQSAGGRLRGVALHGDFFALRDITALEAALAEQPFEASALRAAIADAGGAAAFVPGLEDEALLGLLLGEA